MSQTLTMLLDAYRELNSRKLFWVTLILSGLVVAAFALVGINEKGLQIVAWDIPVPTFNTTVISEETFYKGIFVDMGIGFWLAWLATILALVSTAGIVPDFISSGSIDLLLSKPIGRVRLFLTKYLTGLLFVALQVGVFCTASFFVLGLRGGAWEPGVFLAIPLVVIFYSYLFSICALLGLLTRSTIAALLLTLLIWFFIFAVHAAESGFMGFRLLSQQQVEAMEQSVQSTEAQIAALEAADRPEVETRIEQMRTRLQEQQQELEDTRSTVGKLQTGHRIMLSVKTGLPKTAETIGLLERWLIDVAELPLPEEGTDQEQIQRQAMEEIRDRSAWWILGTSLGFEAVILALASWIFWRRDF